MATPPEDDTNPWEDWIKHTGGEDEESPPRMHPARRAGLAVRSGALAVGRTARTISSTTANQATRAGAAARSTASTLGRAALAIGSAASQATRAGINSLRTINTTPSATASHNTAVWMAFIIALAVHFLDIYLRLSGASFTFFNTNDLFMLVIYLVEAVIFTLFLTQLNNNWKLALLISLGSYGMPYLNLISADTPWLPVDIIIGVILIFAPLWPIFIAFSYPHESPRLKLLGKIYLLTWVFFIILGIFAQGPLIRAALPNIVTDIEIQGINPGKVISTLYTTTKTWTFQTFNQATGYYTTKKNETLQNLQGDYYTGRVDTAARQKLGVFLDNVRLDKTKLDTGEDFTLFGNIKIITLDTPINLTIHCSGTSITPQDITIYPKPRLTIDTTETIPIDCIYNNGFPQVLTANAATLNVTFNYVTKAYIKTYFIDKETLRTLHGASIDPFRQYAITDKNPSAVYTSGPLMTGLQIGGESLNSIDRTQQDTSLVYGITLRNLWDGTIVNITKITLILPKGFTIADIPGITPDNITRTTCAQAEPNNQACLDNIYTIYDVILPNINYQDQPYITLRARLNADQDNYNTILGTTPITTKYFKATIHYTYRLSQTLRATVRDATQQTTTTTPTLAGTGPKIIFGPTLLRIARDTTTITWTTDTLSKDYIIYNKYNQQLKKQTIPPDTPTIDHNVTITGLSPQTAYEYKIISEASTTARTINDGYTFTTK